MSNTNEIKTNFTKVPASCLASWLLDGQPQQKKRVLYSEIPGYDCPVHGTSFKIKTQYANSEFFIREDEIYLRYEYVD